MDINARGIMVLRYAYVRIYTGIGDYGPPKIPNSQSHYKTPDTLATNKSIAINQTVAINLFLNVHPCFLSPIKIASVSNNVITFYFYMFLIYLI